MASVRKVAKALDLPAGGLNYYVAHYFSLTPDSVEDISLRIHQDGFESWKIHLFDFVDGFRRDRDSSLLQNPPLGDLDPKLRALVASTVEMLCAEWDVDPPSWCRGVPALDKPWFVSGVESLKAPALVESPAPFRARNIFVLGNFLRRA